MRVNDVPDSKPDMRNRSLKRRDAMTAEERRAKSLAIATHGAEALAPEIAGKRVAGYHPIRSEVDVGLLTAVRVAVPAPFTIIAFDRHKNRNDEKLYGIVPNR